MQSLDLTQLAIGFAVLIVSLSVHEAAHAWTADRLGDRTARVLGRVSLNPMVHVDPIGTLLFPLIAMLSQIPLIGWAKPVPVNLRNLQAPRRDFMLVAAAGPASNLALAVMGALLLRTVGGSTGLIEAPQLSVPGVLWDVVRLNVLLAVFNMIPVPPLDGGNVLSGLLPPAAAAQYDRVRPWGFLVLYGLMLTGTLGLLVVPPARFLLTILL